MCGLVVLSGPNAKTRLYSSMMKLKHRGPDDYIEWHSESLSIGFVRLAINDTSEAGQQPYQYGSLISAINGEIFNADKLRKQLSGVIESDNDCHVVAPIYHRAPSRILDELDGFFAGVIFDTLTEKLYTLRDFIGKKPLFIGRSGEEVFITSELKAISKIDSFSPLPLGVTCVDLKTGAFEQQTEHKLPISSNTLHPLERDHHYSGLVSRMRLSVEKRIPQNNDRFGLFLSGGVDSSILASIISRSTDAAIYYSLADESSMDFTFIQTLSRHLQLPEVKFIKLPESEVLHSLIEEIVYITESYNPSVVSNGLCTYLLSCAAHEDGLKVVLSGEGADELFGGYHYFKSNQNWQETRLKLLEDLPFTELRRVDLTSMAKGIECRCPFLDREVYDYATQLTYSDLYRLEGEAVINKYALRRAFSSQLPGDIAWRKKTSFDVGSGIRRLVVEHLNKIGEETVVLKSIWKKYFHENYSSSYTIENDYFHRYPVFEKAISNRGCFHR